MKKAFKEGDIVTIQLPNGQTAVAWVVYVSNYFKDIVGILVYGRRIQKEEIGLSPAEGEPLYTAGTSGKHYGWTIIGHKAVSEVAREKTRRIVGGEVFVGDECLGSATDEDRESLHRMGVMGMPLIYDEIQSRWRADGGSN